MENTVDLDHLQHSAADDQLELHLGHLGKGPEGIVPVAEARAAVARDVDPRDRHAVVRGHVLIEDVLDVAVRIGVEPSTEIPNGDPVCRSTPFSSWSMFPGT